MACWITLQIKKLEVGGKIYKLIESFLSNRLHRVVLNGQNSNWMKISAGVTHGSILGLLLFLIYIDNLSVGLKSDVKFFADDTSIFTVVHDKTL